MSDPDYTEIKDEPRIPEPEEEIPDICAECDEDAKTCGKCVEDCEAEDNEARAQDYWDGQRDARD